MTELELQEITKRGHVRIKGEIAPLKVEPEKPAQIIKQGNKQPNKTEKRFELEKLQPMRHAGEITEYKFEAITLKLAPGCRYTPDWSAVNAAGKTVFFEIKGKRIWDDAIVKFKLAPSIFPQYEFYLCQWTGKLWLIQKGLA